MMDDDAIEFLNELEQGGPRPAASAPQGQRPCPVCSEKMLLEDQYGVQIDVCPAHGIWLDRGELSAIAGRIRSGEKISRSRAIRQAKKDGKMSGAMFGVWSLFFD